jgi:hypothetical protein
LQADGTEKPGLKIKLVLLVLMPDIVTLPIQKNQSQMEAGSILEGMETQLMHQNQRANEAEICFLPIKNKLKEGL